MKCFACLLLCFIFFSGCGNKKGKEKQPVTVQFDLNEEGIIKRFALPFNENLQLDSSNLIFYYTKPFDTTFVMHLKEMNGVVSGVYYEVLPSFHSDIGNYFDQKSELLFFEGYSFKIDNHAWSEIKIRAKELLAQDSILTTKTCFDCSSYFLGYDFKIRRDNKENILVFKKLADYLRTAIVSGFNKIKREREELVSSKSNK